MEKSRTVYICQQCGKESLRWVGKCPNCQAWNSFVEQTVKETKSRSRAAKSDRQPEELSRVVLEATERFPVPIDEFNRVLGGGIVPGSLVLIGGEPGIGKSTLLLQASALLAKSHGRVVYVSGEETPNQIKIRAKRLGIAGDGLYLLAETDVDAVLEHAEELQPSLLIIDSIQTAHTQEDDGISGSITQVRQSAQRLMSWAKSSGVPVFITGHVTKEGAIAGPRVLEHIVDVVLYLEGEQFSAYRLLRCVKNRFGSTNEIGVFEMKGKGLLEVENPSLAFLSQRQEETVGSVVVPVIEGSRPLLVEIQALTNATSFGMPRRTANGVDFNRLLMVTAVLTRRLGMKLGNQDIMVNVTGGLKIDEPAADLGIALAIVSSFRDVSVDHELAAVGEIGLSGELRAVPQLERRVSEAARLGFKRILTPKAGGKITLVPEDIEVLAFGSLREAVERGLGK
ncbi:MAG: DNA repair protein RadA [Dehalococcoidales bacterium]|nr:DNA repair protein RadA [Dehalococcoidales bacterium]